MDHMDHTETNQAPKPYFRLFGVFLGYLHPPGCLIVGDKSESVVDAPQYRAAANTAMGWLSRSRAQ